MHEAFMRRALELARRGYGRTSPNPTVGALLVKSRAIIGRGWHRRAGEPHAEIEAMRDAQRHGHALKGAALYVTLEPCSTQGRTPPCTESILNAGIKLVVVGATDPNPRHRGRAFRILERAGVRVISGVLASACERLNEAFNYWIVQGTPWVTVKAAMTLDGKIATPTGESKWITGPRARAHGMRLRLGADAILVGINTVLADDPSLTVRATWGSSQKTSGLRRIILDARARTPLNAKVITDDYAALTTVVVTGLAPQRRVAQLAKRVNVVIAPRERSLATNAGNLRPATSSKAPLREQAAQIALPWLLKRLGAEGVTSLLVEGGGEVNASFLMARLAHRVAFFYAPKILGGHQAYRAVAGNGAESLAQTLDLVDLEWRRFGPDWFMTARVDSARKRAC
jgi:diaminohydroxyphosphoribosylaminopyrimidine deaminase/5-amino-6-(5-phosphoribosylamino)uracil reductase